ncbi:MAG TPA: carbamoyltransferase HypF [Candidatus Hydrogenedens sp.]|nr:carbamoyltransferase HypF [Candidatus Hydrogenedens sp.]
MANCSGQRRVGIVVEGAVQGVGFRPFVYRIATQYRLTGQVQNRSDGVYIEVQGKDVSIDKFLYALKTEHPKHAYIDSIKTVELQVQAEEQYFRIYPSNTEGIFRTRILPDIATCPDCLREMKDPTDRRYRYPFINCTLCGPRYTIINKMPYDRANTSMSSFPMCPQCREEYENPANRRFHAEPIACPICGPQIYLWDEKGKKRFEREEALTESVSLIKNGAILAIKGLGGFHLVVDATNLEAVRRLRNRKNREEKPFALMYPTLEEVKKDCVVSDVEASCLTSSESPILLLEKRADSARIVEEVAPDQSRHGVMLPYTPLHHLLMSDLNIPIVATSGNRSDEPICIDEQEAVECLRGIADYFLVHNRPIVRHVDDSIIHVVMDKPILLRRSRGYVPQPIPLPETTRKVFLAVGGHLKNTVAVNCENQALISQHLGDLETQKAIEGFRQSTGILLNLVERTPDIIVADAHPDYISTQWAYQQNKPVIQVQHHIAHALAVIAEKKVPMPVFAVIWDGTGFGLDHTVWGGEFFVINENEIRRWGHLRTFPLPGGDRAVREPRRSALGILYEMYGNSLFEKKINALEYIYSAFQEAEWFALQKMLKQNINTPITSSAGRLFDAVSMLLGLRSICSFEAQSAMALETLAWKEKNTDYITIPVVIYEKEGQYIIDWKPMVEFIIEHKNKGLSPSQLASLFHQYLARCIEQMVKKAGITNVVINGGCFQNRFLLEYTISLLRSKYNVYFAEQVPPNDGCISLGQIYYALKYTDTIKEK